MFEKFTERARQVVVQAQDEARRMKHNYIGTEHILLGLLLEEEGLAARVLAKLDVTLYGVRKETLTMIGRGDAVIPGQIPLTPRAKKVLELALREALSLGHNYIGTEHVLLGMVREDAGSASRILNDMGAHPEQVRAEVLKLLSVPSGVLVGSGEAPSPRPSLEDRIAERVVQRLKEELRRLLDE